MEFTYFLNLHKKLPLLPSLQGEVNKRRGNNKQRYKSAGSVHEYLMEYLDVYTRG